MTRDFFKNVLLNNISQGLQFGSRWLMNIVLLKVLSIETFAAFSFVYSISNILACVFPFGSHIYLIKKAEKSSEGIKELAGSMSIILTLFVLSIFGFGLYYFLDTSNADKLLILLSVFLSLILSLNTVIFSFLKGVGNFSFELKIYSVFSLLVFLMTGYLYFVNTLSVSTIFMILIGINFLIFVLTFKFSSILEIKQLLGFIDFKFDTIKRKFSNCFYFGLQEILTVSFSQGGMLILFYIISNKIYGEYRAILILTAPFTLVNVAVAHVLLSYLKKMSQEKIGITFRRIQTLFVGLLTGLLMIMYFFGEPIVKIVTGLEYNDTIRMSYIGVLIIIFTSFVYSGYEMLLVIINRQKFRVAVMLIGAVTNIVSIVVLLPKFGLLGAVMTNVLSNIAVFISIIIVSEKSLKNQNENCNNYVKIS